ncbi:helix-turn-helix domain-containing protein [Streptomyces sp. NPDC003444]|uniref:helix-turn-helix domain-containing protein n=1 Tax=unclassified Streptomyces TaxID=2593676 RepID=UPI00136DDA27|nr:helix-turn-helix domain-containing protein [Streptomyces sp. SID5770]MZE52906.1 helix-turn-helix domain-containing protein [Streptomyces sp. SID5770]
MHPGSVAIALVNDTDMGVCEVYETAIAYAVFGDPQPDLADPWYDLRVCSVSPSSSSAEPARGFSVRTSHGIEDLVTADTVIVPSVPDAVARHGASLPAEFTDALRRAHASGARVVSLCTGAFALAEAGLLDGRRAAAHWMNTADLAARYPEVEVDDSVLYVDEGRVLTSAGMTAGLDLCLHLVRSDLGAHVANQLARRLVVSGHRPGGQAQFVDLSVPVTDDDSLAPVLDWAARHLDEPLTVDDMAGRAGMSTRTFFRRLRAATGMTPLKWLLNQRLAHARTLLETTDLPVERIGEFSGLGTAANLRRHFTLHVGVTPTDYRQSFGSAPARARGKRPAAPAERPAGGAGVSPAPPVS